PARDAAHGQSQGALHVGLPRRTRNPGSRNRADLELRRRGLRQRPQLRPPCLRGGRHLRHLPAPGGHGRHHQPSAARRPHGLRALAGLDLDRVAAEGRPTAAAGALGIDAQHRALVREAAMGTRDPRVDAYIARSADFARPLLAAIREAAHAALPGMREDIKWGAPAFMQDGIVAIMASFKQHCALNFWRGKELVGDARNSEAMGQFGALKSPADLPPRRELVRLFKDAARLNASGAPAPARKPKPPPKVPPDLAAALAK